MDAPQIVAHPFFRQGAHKLPSVFLKTDVFACLTGGHLVLLDARNDKYLCIERVRTRHSSLLPDKPSGSRDDELTASAEIESLLATSAKELIAANVVTMAAREGKPPGQTTTLRPKVGIQQAARRPRVHVTPLDLVRFVCSMTVTSIRLRTGGIQGIFASLTEMRARRQPIHFGDSIESFHRVVAVFNALRPFYPAAFVCLFDSLGLLHMMARYGLYPTLVLGVRTEPWSAHCWLQVNDVVLNDTLQRVSTHTPILAI